ncbi:carbohydrate sulfotransferase 4-like isoform X2 [Eriocheir sinensis]|uniref:carbohydrate sulfotransferase 4-like isoform X2 n=1 Tax=Eriocheir sinensis TaxID=95602 RepID=UPI0021C7A063|nr:carbohydrate sulfotransferase 4-like isoform X2 [Eriocheir sinensis]
MSKKRRLQQAWLSLLGSRARRFLLVSLLFSALLAAQLITSYSKSAPTTTVPDDDEATAGSPEQQATLKAAYPTVKNLNMKQRQADATRARLLDAFANLETRDLQKAMKLYESTWNSAAVQKARLEHAVMSLKMTLLEEVSAHGYGDLMAAAHHARPLSDTPRPGPLQVVIATTWRSGSTFLEELLTSHPAVYNHYEPLMQFGLKQIRDGEEAIRAQRLIHDLLSCRYQGQEDYIRTAREIRELLTRNKQVWKVCSADDLGDALCFNDTFLTQACLLFPWSAMKLVRLRLRLLRPVLMDSTLNVRVIYLVRDPRGVINSRTDTVQWCKTSDCIDPHYLCRDMEDDLKAARDLQKSFPGRVYILRYEDMSLNPANKTRELLNFLDFDFDPHMEEFLSSHTTKNYDKPWSTSRDSKTRVTYWTSKLGHDKLRDVQTACSSVMAKFGYLAINSTSGVTVDKILGPFKMPSS